MNMSYRKRHLIAVIAALLPLLLSELLLRVAGFHYTSEVAYGSLRPQFRAAFAPDNDLFWKFPPGTEGINSFGFRGLEVQVPKNRHTKRLLFLGDSCAEQGYAFILESLLNQNAGSDSQRFECVVLAAPGYSSYQGKVLARKYGGLLQADLAFACFGWNDHWLANGHTDEEIGADRFRKVWSQLYYHSRLLQAVEKLVHLIVGSQSRNETGQVRVPLEQYGGNLAEIDSIFRGHNVPVVFLTSPSCHLLTGVPSRLLDDRLASSSDSVIAMHAAYNDFTRATANRLGERLLDLESEFRALQHPEALFISDGIHYSSPGLQFVAHRINRLLHDDRDLARLLSLTQAEAK